MIKLYKAFILFHFEYASTLFKGLSKARDNQCICSKDSSKSAAYEELLKSAYIKKLNADA